MAANAPACEAGPRRACSCNAEGVFGRDTGFIIAEGTCDASGKVITYRGEGPDPMSGQTKRFKSVLRIVNKNKHVFDVYGTTPDGKEFKSAEVTYTRK